jgi:hypothetical protein
VPTVRSISPNWIRRSSRISHLADGQTIVAPLPEGTRGHFGPNLRRFVLMQYHQGQSTLPRLTAPLHSVGVSISEREIERLLTEKQGGFLDENRDVLRTGLETSPWLSVDDTGARHKAKNGFCTQIGNDRFTWFGSRSSKTRLRACKILGVRRPLTEPDHRWWVGIRDSDGESRPPGCRSARRYGRRGRTALSPCSNASAASCSCAWQ